MMRWSLCSAIRQAPAWSMLLLAVGCAPTAAGGMAPPAVMETQPTAVAMPGELHGFWVWESSSCPAPDAQYDGDLMLEISSDRIVGHEEVHRPVAVVRLADRSGWRIETLIDVGPSGVFEPGGALLFALDGGILIVEDRDAINRYRRCPAG